MKKARYIMGYLIAFLSLQSFGQQWQSFNTYMAPGGEQVEVLSDGSYCVVGSINDGDRTFEGDGYKSQGGKDFYWSWIDSSYNVQSVYSYGGTGDDNLAGFAVDDEDNIYILGYFENVLTLGSDTFISKGGNDIFLAKFSLLDGAVLWAKAFGTDVAETTNSLGDLSFNDNIVSFAASFGYNIYSGNLDRRFDSLAVDSYTLVSHGNQDVVYGGVDKFGNIVHLQNIGGVGNDYPQKIRNTPKGLYLMISPQFKFEEEGVVYQAPSNMGSNQNSSLIHFSFTDSIDWVRFIGYRFIRDLGTVNVHDIEIDAEGNTYVAGNFYAKELLCDNKTVTGPNEGSGGFDVYYVKIDTEGRCKWLKAGGAFGQDRLTDLLVYDSNRIIIGGRLSGGGWFGQDTIPSSNQEAFLLEFDSQGNNLNFELLCGTQGSIVNTIRKLPNERLLVFGGTGEGVVKLGNIESEVWSDGGNVFLAKRNFKPVTEDTFKIHVKDSKIYQDVFFPNPTTNVIYINSLIWHRAKVSLYGVQGNLVSETIVTDNRINIGNIKNGIYRLELTLDDRFLNKLIQIKNL